MAFSTIRRETLETQVHEALRKAILEGRLARGEREGSDRGGRYKQAFHLEDL